MLKLQASAPQLISAINSWALGSFKYSVGIVDWSHNSLKAMDLMIRQRIGRRGLRGSRGGKKHLYLPRKQGGRGLQSAKTIERAAYIRLDNYIQKELRWLRNAFPTSEVLQRIRMRADEAKHKVGGAETPKEFIKKLHDLKLGRLKPLHRGFETAVTTQAGVNKELSRNWLAKQNLSPEIENTYFQIKEEMVQTREVLLKRWGAVQGGTTCRHCNKEPESLDHILSGCTALGFTSYKERHDQVARQVAKAILDKFEIEWKYEYWTTPLPKSFTLTREGKKGELLWDPKVKTVNKMEHNHPDMVLRLPEGPVAIIEFTVCRDLSVVERATQKEARYQQLAADWAVKHGTHPTVIPIVVGTRGVVPERTVESLKTLKRWGIDVEISRLQKAAAMGSVKLIWKTLKSSG